MPTATTTAVPFPHGPDIWGKGPYPNTSERVAALSDLKRPSQAHRDAQKAKARQEAENRIAQLRQTQEARYQHLLRLFQQRFEEDQTYFSAFSTQEVFTVFELMTRQMLLFFPTRISPDVTSDASIILQAHYGNLHFYWESFFWLEEPAPHSTLNVFHEQKLILTLGDSFTAVQQQLIAFITPLFKKLIVVQIE